MNRPAVLSALAFSMFAAACNPGPGAPEPIVPPPHVPAIAAPEAASEVPDTPPADEAPELTAFQPSTVEIYCGFHPAGEAPSAANRLFITQIAGVPAPAAVGLEGQEVRLEEVSKTGQGGAEIWTYRNEDRPVEVQLTLTGTDEGFEFRSYEGAIKVMAPVEGDVLNIEGTCGV